MRKLLALVSAALVVGGCSVDDLPEGGALEVVATVSPLFDAAGSVGGDRIHASNLLQVDPFGSITPEGAEELREASLAVVLGGGTQPDVERVVAERDGPTIRVLDEMVTQPGFEPNVWLDPNNMALIGELITAQLIVLDPAGEEDYEENQADLVQQIADVDRLYERTLATCERREIVTTTPEYSYLADRYRLQQIDVGGKALAEVARRRDVTTVFSTSFPDLDEAQRILNESGLRSAVLDPMASRTDQARRGGAVWNSVASINLDALREALDCERIDLGDE